VVSAQEKLHHGVVEVAVHDNGIGIPKEVFSKIVRRGFSFGKKDGNGLGEHEALTQLWAWGGDLKIESEFLKRYLGLNLDRELLKLLN